MGGDHGDNLFLVESGLNGKLNLDSEPLYDKLKVVVRFERRFKVARRHAKVARQALDRRVRPLQGSESVAVPAGGWIRAVRDALAMSAAQLGLRLGLTRQAVIALERSEVEGGIRLASLRRAAEALDCRVVYAFVPNTSLDERVRRRAAEVAASEIGRIDQTMLLEAQRVERAVAEEQLAALTESLIDSSRLWDDV